MTEGSNLNLQDFFEEDNKIMKENTGEDYQVVTFSSSKYDIANVDDLEKEYQSLSNQQTFSREKYIRQVKLNSYK
jgi:hypothetical protein